MEGWGTDSGAILAKSSTLLSRGRPIIFTAKLLGESFFIAHQSFPTVLTSPALLDDWFSVPLNAHSRS